jgi:hypothetical protein
MKVNKVSIPKPCKESWDSMTPKGNGRHCDSCDKTVVDFTAMTLEQIKIYFDKNKGTRVCGHFKTVQVETQRPASHRHLIRLYEYLEQTISIGFLRTIPLSIVALFMVLVGCQEKTTTGEPIPNYKQAEHQSTGDTLFQNQDSLETLDGEAILEMSDSTEGGK